MSSLNEVKYIRMSLDLGGASGKMEEVEHAWLTLMGAAAGGNPNERWYDLFGYPGYSWTEAAHQWLTDQTIPEGGKLNERFYLYWLLDPSKESDNHRLLISFPSGQAGAYTATEDDAQIIDDAASFASSNNIALNASGWLTNSGAGAALQISGLNAYRTSPYPSYREYAWDVYVSDTPADGDHVDLIFNLVDGNNYWIARLSYALGTNRFDILLYEVTAGTPSVRDSTFFTSHTPGGTLLAMRLSDTGDNIRMWAERIDESAPTTLHEALINNYDIVSRPHKGNTGCQLGWGGSTGKFHIRTLSVFDVYTADS